MPVTDDQFATLRAQLAGDHDEHERLWAQLDPEAARVGYTALVAAAFCEAVERRFAPNGTRTDVIDFVGDVRSRSDQVAAALDPRTAERLILGVYTDEDVSDIEARSKGGTQLAILMALVADERFDAAGLDAFLANSRKLANEWIG